MNNTKKREVWLRELKELRKELLEKSTKNQVPSAYPGASTSKTYQKKMTGLGSKMYESDGKQSAKIQILMLAFLTFMFETLFFIGSYFLFRK